MKNRHILLSPWYLLCLTLLLTNDLVLKELWGNWFTGKLSDFAGLVVFALFWTVFFPQYKKTIFWLTGLLFIFWKSPFSQSLIDFWNAYGWFSIQRVVDYTDLMALVVLPVTFILTTGEHARTRIHQVIPAVFTVFAFLATSYVSSVELGKTYHFDLHKDSLLVSLNNLDSFYIDYQDTTSDGSYIINLGMPFTECRYVDLEVLISGQDGASEMTLIAAIARNCDIEEDKELIIQEIERHIGRIEMDMRK